MRNCDNKDEANLQNNINKKFLILISLFQKQTKNRILKFDYQYKNENWTLMQKTNEKWNEKTGPSC